MAQLFTLNPSQIGKLAGEYAVSAYADKLLQREGYAIRHQKTGNPSVDCHWPSKATLAPIKKVPGKKGGAAKPSHGAPDLLLYLSANAALPFCIWENKEPKISADLALADAKFYVFGLHKVLPAKPGLPRLAAGFNGRELKVAYLTFAGQWVDVKVGGVALVNQFPTPEFAVNGISANGNFNAVEGRVSKVDLRRVLPRLKTLYRSIPALASGRAPIDFTVALLTLKMLVESRDDWGTWAEQPALVPDATSIDHAIGERLKLLVNRVLSNSDLKVKYGAIFHFRESVPGQQEDIFEFIATLGQIEVGQGFFQRIFEYLDELPPLHGADFDVFGEVYQSIGDDATKKALGEFFTGRHIIAAVVPVLMSRAGAASFDTHVKGKLFADIACGTGGFLTETLRYMRTRFNLNEAATKAFAETSFYGYDLSSSNASRARVNMYFAGDGFSTIQGGFDSLANGGAEIGPFDFILTNPPYGSSARYQRLEEAFLRRIVDLLREGAGWGLVVLPTGVLENPRSSGARLALLQRARVTDVISLPPHAFAPYTKQRTSVLIFQRRPSDLAVSGWSDLVDQIQHEEVSLFIVDNDGFANSDKRYETARQDATGKWLHDDLSAWIDSKTGKKHDGKLFSSLILKQQLGNSKNEFGEPLGAKYGVFSILRLADMSSDRSGGTLKTVDLLPDIYLRPLFQSVPFGQFISNSAAFLTAVKQGQNSSRIPLLEQVKQLLATRVDFYNGKALDTNLTSVSDAFKINKGDQGLTEAMIYQQFEATGLPVYGGGEGVPRFFLGSGATNKAGKPVTVHSGPALVISMDGSSGSVRHIHSGNFVVNHHGAVLKLKHGLKLNLDYVAQQLEGGLRSLSSNKDGSATLTLPALKSYRFQLPPNAAASSAVAKVRQAAAAIRDKFG
ncbi:MAG: hypothetical protein ABS82_15270 [Rhodanobacter sp. SCN 67-45]|nr:MAG: hypothetical protein ABS82_15270 [Rhodanobacter sp. SCN 67-45]